MVPLGCATVQACLDTEKGCQADNCQTEIDNMKNNGFDSLNMQTKSSLCDCFAPKGVCGCPVYDKLPERYREEIPEFEEEQSHITL